MGLDIPHRYEPQIREVAEAQHITPDEALDLILRAGLERLSPTPTPAPKSYASLFGTVKGAGAHGSQEAVDRYVEELRTEW